MINWEVVVLLQEFLTSAANSGFTGQTHALAALSPREELPVGNRHQFVWNRYGSGRHREKISYCSFRESNPHTQINQPIAVTILTEMFQIQ